jgi:hypothetical protein
MSVKNLIDEMIAQVNYQRNNQKNSRKYLRLPLNHFRKRFCFTFRDYYGKLCD